MMRYISILVIVAIMSIACKKQKPSSTTTPYIPTPYNVEVPFGFPSMAQPSFNLLTEEGVELGRHLYYDTILSTIGRACASCHHQSLSFSVPMGPGGFSVPPHINLGWKTSFTWTGAEEYLDHVAIIDLSVPDFIGPNMALLQQRLEAHEKYQEMFRKAYDVDITNISVEEQKKYISYALGQFMRTIISGNSKFDRVMQGKEFFNDSELRGYEIFFTEKGDCFHCHGTALFRDDDFHNIGLDSIFGGIDRGRYLVTSKLSDIGKFSTPTLRNIDYTAPYMHDGRFQSLEEVVEFYNSQVKNSVTLDPIMTKPGKGSGLNLTAQDKQDLVSFLKTLTDTSLINKKEYSNPFQ